jgi:hypothetical protein
VLDRLRPALATFRDDRGRELFDLPQAPRPDPGVPAPPRFLGQFDNVLLGHADRRRIIPEGLSADGVHTQGRDRQRFVNHLLVDGTLKAKWWIEREGKRHAILTVSLFGELSAADRDQVTEEGQRMVGFAAADAESREVHFEQA